MVAVSFAGLVALRFVAEPWSGWMAFSPTSGEGPVIQVRYRLESFGGAGKEWEWQFRNAGAQVKAVRG